MGHSHRETICGPASAHGHAPTRRRRLALAAIIAACALAAALLGSCGSGTVAGDDAPPGGVAATEQASGSAVEQAIGSMTLEQKVAQLFIIKPSALAPDQDPVTLVNDEVRAAYAAYPVGGLLISRPSLVDPEQTTALTADLQETARQITGLPLFLCVDEEGGTVVRVAGNDAFGVEDPGDAAAIGATGDPDAAFEAARGIGTYLKPLGLNMDFAPVCDIASTPESTMAQRSFGATTTTVALMVAAQVRGFHESGILCCAKHFPGIGDSMADSHDGAIASNDTLAQMRTEELIPFAAAIEQGADFVMVGHIACPGITGDDTPASLSPVIIGDLLRGELGYEGIVVTDSLEMKAVSERCAPSRQAVLAIQAGNDMVLDPVDFPAAYQGLLDAVRSGEVPEERIDQSLARIIRVKLKL